MKEQAAKPPPEPSPFERFTEFTRRILAVPKSEIDRRHREWKRRRRNKTKGKA